MPMHDWTRITANEFHSFHGRWAYAICDALNAGLLPDGFYALTDYSLRTIVPDVATLRRPAADGTKPGLHLLTDPPRTRFALAEASKPRTRTRRIAVRSAQNHTVVAIVEVVSPGNKRKRSELRTFVDKAAGALDAGVHVLVADPFPPGRFDPDGIHGAIWAAATGRPFALPAEKPLTLAAYAAQPDGSIEAFVEPVAVGDALRDMPLFLTPEEYVSVPLEATYQVAWNAFPGEMRRVVAP